MKRVKWPVRATPSCPTFPYGVKEELIEVEYEPHEAGMLAALGTRLHDPDPEVQREGMNEILVLHELKALTGARVLTEGDMIERGIEPLQVPAGYLPGTSQGTSQVHDEDPIQTTMIPPEGTESLLFRIPPTARKKLGMVEPDNAGYQPVVDAQQAAHASEQGQAQALRAERVTIWKAAASSWLSHRQEGDEITADKLVEAIGLPDEGVARNNVVGAWFSSMSKSGRITWTGNLVKSERVIGHQNLQRVWRVNDVAQDARRESA